MERRLFLRNVMMGIAVSLLPKILQPTEPKVIEEELIVVPVTIHWTVINNELEGIKFNISPMPTEFVLNLTQSQKETLEQITNG